MAKIDKVWAREIIDSRAVPTVEATVVLDNNIWATAAVPSGASTGSYEAIELRDGDMNRFFGKGVLKAVENVTNVIGPAIKGIEATDQAGLDKKIVNLDGTKNKSKLGANATLAVSLAVLKTGAISSGRPVYQYIADLCAGVGVPERRPNEGFLSRLPVPIFNMINGGLHGAGNLDFQEFHVIPASNKLFAESLRIGAEVYVTLEKALERRGAVHSVGDEGGYAPNLFTNMDALEILLETIGETTYVIGQDLFLGLDTAASTFYKAGKYAIRDKSSPMGTGELAEYYKQLNSQYHLVLLEDGFSEDDWAGWKMIRQILGEQTLIVGDDLLATNPERVKKAIEEQACNSILVKPNQIGTVSETLEVVKLARGAGWKIIMSHRSGESNDSVIADLAAGTGADFAKFGAPARGERVSKYNRLMAIEQELAWNRQVQINAPVTNASVK